jgi:hypothetical protein
MRYEIGDYADLGAFSGSEALKKALVELFAPNQSETYLIKSSEAVYFM